MNQINFAEDIKKTKSGRLKKAQVIPKVKFTQPTQKKQYYLTIHNKIKVEYRNREYKNVYQRLLKMERPEQAYLPLYFEDLGSSINKMLQEYIVHKDVTSTSNVQACLHQGKDNITRLYKLFTVKQEVTNQRMSVNEELQGNIARFFNIIISFTIKYALICVMQRKAYQAKLLYDSLYKICSNILTSSTSNYKILRKIGQGLIVYSVYLIDSQQIDRAISVLFECLKNQMNLAIILTYRLKQKSKSEIKRRKLELFNRLYAIFFNLTHCFQTKHQLHWCYLCLRECQTIAQLKVKLLQKDIKINWTDIVDKYKNLYDGYIELKKIVQVYFDVRELREQIKISKKYEKSYNNPHEQTHKDVLSINSFQKSHKVDADKKHKRNLRRSVSLQQNLENQNNRRYFKQFGQQILFYGVNLFQKPVSKQRKAQSSVFKLKSGITVSHQQNTNDPLKEHQINTKMFSKVNSTLKKRYKKVENTLFKRIQEPIQYDKLQTKFKKMWEQQQKMNNKCKEKKYLLKYKSQYLNYKEIADQNKSIYQQIQVVNNKNQFAFKEKKKVHEVEQQEKDKGIDLFKRIILRHAKQLDIKKSQTFNVLKKKRKIKGHFQSYTAPDVSVNFLLQKIKKEKQRAEDRKPKAKDEDLESYQKQRHKGNNCQNVFLTKDTVEIPNLFLSYITSSGFSCEAPSSQLEYGHKF